MRKINIKVKNLLFPKILLIAIILLFIYFCFVVGKFFYAAYKSSKDDHIQKEIVTSFDDKITLNLNSWGFPEPKTNLQVSCNKKTVITINTSAFSDYDHNKFTDNLAVLIREHKEFETVIYEFDWGIIYSLDSGQTFYGAPKYIYDDFPLQMNDSFSKTGQDFSFENGYGSSILNNLYKLDMNITAEKITDSASKRKYIEAHTMSNEQIKQYAAVGMRYRLLFDETTLAKITKKAEIKTTEHIEMLKIIGIYDEVLEKVNISEEKYKEAIFNCFVNLEAIDFEFEKLYQTEKYTPDELKKLKNDFVASIYEKTFYNY